MPESSFQGKEQIVDWVKIYGAASVLDIGAGRGTYLKVLSHVIPNATWEAIEVWETYIGEFSLPHIYDKVHMVDARKFAWTDKFYDFVIMGDVLEHMTKDESITLINNALSHSKYCIVSIPIMYSPQGAANGNPYEIHVKDDWTHEEVMETYPSIKHSCVHDDIGVYLLSNSPSIPQTDTVSFPFNERLSEINVRYLDYLHRFADNEGLYHYYNSSLDLGQITNIIANSEEARIPVSEKFAWRKNKNT